METKNNTDGSANSLRGIIKDVRQKARNNSLMQSALVKILNSKKEEITAFLGETKKQFLKNLVFITEIFVGNVTEFIVRDKFQHRAKDKVGIQLYFGDDFTNLVLNSMKNKKVSLANGLILKKFSLLKSIHDTEIQNELQNPKPIDVEIFLPLIWKMMLSQKNGEVKENGLLNNGYTNIFHVKLEDNHVVVVNMFWDGKEWYFGAGELGCAGRWFAGRAFFTLATA